jgi:putative endonuclease
VNRGERLAALAYVARGYRILDSNVRIGGGELDLVVRRGRKLIFVEVKERAAHDRFGGGLAAVDRHKRRRVEQAARAWLAAHPEANDLDIALEAAAVSGTRVSRRMWWAQPEDRPEGDGFDP